MIRRLAGELRRRWLLTRAPAGARRDFLAVPWPRGGQPCATARFLALDLETTGGDPDRDEIVSLGWVCVDGPRIDLGSARHRVVRIAGAMRAESAAVHAITDDEAAAGVPLDAALRELLAALAGRVLIAHYACTELGFVDAACRRLLGGGIVIPAVDTLALALRRQARLRQAPAPGSLRLGALRRHYGLPRYPAHDALSDALAAAELFLAQLAEAPQPPTLADWLA